MTSLPLKECVDFIAIFSEHRPSRDSLRGTGIRTPDVSLASTQANVVTTPGVLLMTIAEWLETLACFLLGMPALGRIVQSLPPRLCVFVCVGVVAPAPVCTWRRQADLGCDP